MILLPVSVSSSGDNAIVAAVADKTVYALKLFLVFGGDVNVTVKAASTPLTGALPMKANGSMVLDFVGGEPWFQTAPGEALVLNLSAAVQVSGLIGFVQQ